MKNINVNEARQKLLSRTFKDEDKTVDMSVLPPCESVLCVHSEKVNYIAPTWKRTTISRHDFPNLVLHR